MREPKNKVEDNSAKSATKNEAKDKKLKEKKEVEKEEKTTKTEKKETAKSETKAKDKEVKETPEDKVNKIKKIRGQKKVKLSALIISVVVIVLATVIVLYVLDRNASIFDGNFARAIFSVEESKKDVIDEEQEKKNVAKAAIEKFKELGENVKESDLTFLKIRRDGVFYYYIESPKNTCEVRVEDNAVTRVNSVKVNE